MYYILKIKKNQTKPALIAITFLFFCKMLAEAAGSFIDGPKMIFTITS